MSSAITVDSFRRAPDDYEVNRAVFSKAYVFVRAINRKDSWSTREK